MHIASQHTHTYIHTYIHIYIYIGIVYLGPLFFWAFCAVFVPKWLNFPGFYEPLFLWKEANFGLWRTFPPPKGSPWPEGIFADPPFPWKNKHLGDFWGCLCGSWGLIPAEKKLHFHRQHFALSLSSLWRYLSDFCAFPVSLSPSLSLSLSLSIAISLFPSLSLSFSLSLQTKDKPPHSPPEARRMNKKKKRKEQERNPKTRRTPPPTAPK